MLYSRPNKFKAKKTQVDGIRFDSKKEAARYQDLLLLQKGGKICKLEIHPVYSLFVNHVIVGRYTADFDYFDNEKACRVVEDVKCPATKTEAYQLRKNVFEALYQIKVTEV